MARSACRLLLCLALSSCGGGGNTLRASPSGADKEAPTVQIAVDALDKTSESPAMVRIRVTAAQDNIDVTAFCLRASSAAPAAQDACFSDVREWTEAIGPAWRVWARDAAGNVSAGVTDNPCSNDAKAAAAASSLPTVCLLTDAGEIVVELESAKAPNSARNFLQYVSDGFYADTVFHRILSDFVVQGGGFAVRNGVRVLKTQADGLRAAIPLEKTSDTGLSNLVGTLAMARTDEANSATSQFFINVVDNSQKLDADGAFAPGQGYAVFGRVIRGMSTTVQILRTAQVGKNGQGEVSAPTRDLFIRWASLMK